MRKPGAALVGVQEQQATPTNFIVDDLSEFEGVPARAEQQTTKQEVAVSPAEMPKNKLLESLIFLGRASRTVIISGSEFEISTLSHREHNDLVKVLSQNTKEQADIWKIRTFTLSFAIRAINSVPIEEIDIGRDFQSTTDKAVFILDNMQLEVISRLFSEYGDLVKESEKAVSGEDIKK